MQTIEAMPVYKYKQSAVFVSEVERGAVKSKPK